MRKAKIFKKCLVYTLIGALTLSNVTPALAYDHLDKVDYDSNKNSIAEVHEEVNVTEDGTSQATVYAELGKEFTITVPKSLTLSGQTKSGTYTVSVEGDIAGTDKINVIPDETFALNSSGLDSITASINQDKTSWGYNEILTDSKVIGNGTINASDLSAGKWNGTFNFNINLEEGAGSGNTGNEEQSILTLSVDDEVAIGADDSLQVNAYMDGQIVNNQVNWQSNNENITVTNGLIETKASAQIGDSATITVTAENPDTLSAMANTLNNLGIATVAMAEDDISIEFTVTIVDIEYSVNKINIKPGESMDVTAKIIPEEINGTVRWSQTAVSGLNLVKNGNTVTIKVANDMETGTYELVATYGDYSKTLKINIVTDEVHTHSYTESVTKESTCTEAGVKTYTCTCGDSYTEEIPATGHSYENGSCTNCGEADPDYSSIEIGTYEDVRGFNTIRTNNPNGTNTITLKYWNNTVENTEVVIYGAYEIDGIIYNTKIWNNDDGNSMDYMFSQKSSITSITFKEGIDTSDVENMSFMFFECTNLTEINGLEYFDVSNVTNMQSMFRKCESLTSLDLTSWNTTNVEKMPYIFSICPALTEVLVSTDKWYVPSASASSMFTDSGISEVTYVDIE